MTLLLLMSAVLSAQVPSGAVDAGVPSPAAPQDNADDLRLAPALRVAAMTRLQREALQRLSRGPRDLAEVFIAASDRWRDSLRAADPAAERDLLQLRAELRRPLADALHSEAESAGLSAAQAGVLRRAAAECVLAARSDLHRILHDCVGAERGAQLPQWRQRNAADLALLRIELLALQRSMVCALNSAALINLCEEFVLRLGEADPESLLHALHGHLLLARLAHRSGNVAGAVELCEDVLGRVVLTAKTEAAVLDLAAQAMQVLLEVRVAVPVAATLVNTLARAEAILALKPAEPGELALLASEAAMLLGRSQQSAELSLLALKSASCAFRAARNLSVSRGTLNDKELLQAAFVASEAPRSELLALGVARRTLQSDAEVRGRWAAWIAMVHADEHDAPAALEWAMLAAEDLLPTDRVWAGKLVDVALRQKAPALAAQRARLERLRKEFQGEAVIPKPEAQPATDTKLAGYLRAFDKAFAAADFGAALVAAQRLETAGASVSLRIQASERVAWLALRTSEQSTIESALLRSCLTAALLGANPSRDAGLWLASVRECERRMESEFVTTLAARAVAIDGVRVEREVLNAGLRAALALALDDAASSAAEQRERWQQLMDFAREIPAATTFRATDAPTQRALAYALGGRLRWSASGASHMPAGGAFVAARQHWAQLLKQADPDSAEAWEARFQDLLLQWAEARRTQGSVDAVRLALRKLALRTEGRFDDGAWAVGLRWLEQQLR